MTDRQPGPDDRFDDPFQDQNVVDRAFAELIAHWADGPYVDGPDGAGSEVAGSEVAGPELDGPELDGADLDGAGSDGPGVGRLDPATGEDTADDADAATRGRPAAARDAAGPADTAAINDIFRDFFAPDPTPPPPLTRAVAPVPPDTDPVEAEERYVPPPVGWPRPSAPVLLGWTGIAAAVVIMLLAAFGLALPPWAGWLAVLAFAIGFGILLSRLPRRRPPGSGDGAVL